MSQDTKKKYVAKFNIIDIFFILCILLLIAYISYLKFKPNIDETYPLNVTYEITDSYFVYDAIQINDNFYSKKGHSNSYVLKKEMLDRVGSNYKFLIESHLMVEKRGDSYYYSGKEILIGKKHNLKIGNVEVNGNVIQYGDNDPDSNQYDAKDIFAIVHFSNMPSFIRKNFDKGSQLYIDNKISNSRILDLFDYYNQDQDVYEVFLLLQLQSEIRDELCYYDNQLISIGNNLLFVTEKSQMVGTIFNILNDDRKESLENFDEFEKKFAIDDQKDSLIEYTDESIIQTYNNLTQNIPYSEDQIISYDLSLDTDIKTYYLIPVKFQVTGSKLIYDSITVNDEIIDTSGKSRVINKVLKSMKDNGVSEYIVIANLFVTKNDAGEYFFVDDTIKVGSYINMETENSYFRAQVISIGDTTDYDLIEKEVTLYYGADEDDITKSFQKGDSEILDGVKISEIRNIETFPVDIFGFDDDKLVFAEHPFKKDYRLHVDMKLWKENDELYYNGNLVKQGKYITLNLDDASIRCMVEHIR